MGNVFDDFRSVQPSTSSTEFQALRLQGGREDYLAKGPNGNPVFLLTDAKASHYHPSLQLRYLNAEFQLTCRLRTEQGEVEGVFALVSCTSEEAELHELFIRSFNAVREQLSGKAQTDEIKKTVQDLALLFRAFSKPSQRSIAGLWAELFTIARSDMIVDAMKMWRADPFDKLDFSSLNRAIEVKATNTQSRSHEFSLEQLSIPVGGQGFVVSLLLQAITGGTSVLELVSTIEGVIVGEPKLRQKLWENVINDLGSDFGTSLDRRFDMSYAQRYCRIFKFEDVPQPQSTPDPQITKIRFVADCSTTISSVSESSFAGLQQIFTSVQ